MARKKKTPSDAKPEKAGEVSKAEAISGAVKDAELDTPDAAMADTSLDDAPEELVGAEDATDEAEVVETDPAQEDVAPEDDATPASEPPAEPAPDVAAAESPAESSGFAAPFFGGVLAAIIGFGGAIVFGAAEWPVFGGKPDENPVQVELQAKVAEQSTALEAITAELAALQATLTEGQASDGEAFAEITARLDDLPTTSAELMPEDLRALLSKQKTEMDALQGSLDQMAALAEGQIASAQEQQENAAIAEARAKARGALNSVRTALTSGSAYAAALPEIAAAADVPEVLQANAETGVPTAEALVDGFGPAARNALSSSMKATAGDAPSDRVLLFLKDQLGARSLTPREGDDPDAVLSRAEAAVRSGDVSGALDLISALPEEGQAALQDWAGLATTRKDALTAFDSLADALSAN